MMTTDATKLTRRIRCVRSDSERFNAWSGVTQLGLAAAVTQTLACRSIRRTVFSGAGKERAVAQDKRRRLPNTPQLAEE